MSERRKSKEELYLQKAYQLAGHEIIDRYAVGTALGYHNRSVNTIVQNLTQSHFLKKTGDQEIHVTDAGLSFLEDQKLV